MPPRTGQLSPNRSTAEGLPAVVEQIERAFVKSETAASTSRDTESGHSAADETPWWDERIDFPLSEARRAQLLTERPDHWEYFLFADGLSRGLAEHESAWRDHHYGLVGPSGEYVPRDEVNTYIHRACREIVGTMENVTRLLDPVAQEAAFGRPGEPGDAVAIEHLCHRLMGVYGQCLYWAASVRSTRCSDDHRRVLDLLAAMGTQPILDIRAFVERCAHDIGMVPVWLAAPGNDPLKLSLTLTLTLDANSNVVKAYEKERKRLKRRRKL
jgi:hypothetical protein